MRAIDCRNETFENMMGCFSGLRKTVYKQFKKHGPCTTRGLAEFSGLDILTVRPRTTELLGMGLITLIGSIKGNGVYKAVNNAQAQLTFNAKKRDAKNGQMFLFPSEEVAGVN